MWFHCRWSRISLLFHIIAAKTESLIIFENLQIAAIVKEKEELVLENLCEEIPRAID